MVIDAKMTLVAYERYFNAEDDYTRESALQEHIASVRNHIRLLDAKIINSCRGCEPWITC
ncbi:DNA recombination protein [Escherichia coli]|uniref:DNA recombination protein RmuC n=1 Tax=Escherichia coli TaxID=562 RepID=A0A376MM83_ECOLX|nr:DNA recombination protein [Escherichia coli]